LADNLPWGSLLIEGDKNEPFPGPLLLQEKFANSTVNVEEPPCRGSLNDPLRRIPLGLHVQGSQQNMDEAIGSPLKKNKAIFFMFFSSS